jgi:hypothetical protein
LAAWVELNHMTWESNASNDKSDIRSINLSPRGITPSDLSKSNQINSLPKCLSNRYHVFLSLKNKLVVSSHLVRIFTYNIYQIVV